VNAMTAFSLGKGGNAQQRRGLEAALRQIGAMRYHNLHPFHRLLHGGKLNKGQVQAWALNRYYYQSSNSDQGRRGDLALPRPRHPARMAAPDRRP